MPGRLSSKLTKTILFVFVPALACASVAVAGCGDDSNTSGARSCVADVDCKGDRICEDRRCVDAPASDAATACVDRCQAQGGDRSLCERVCYGANGSTGGAPGTAGAGGSTGGFGGSTGGAEGTGATGNGATGGVSSGRGQGPEVCGALRIGTTTAHDIITEGGNPDPTLNLEFYDGGALYSVNGELCTPDDSVAQNFSDALCVQGYVCGNCPVNLVLSVESGVYEFKLNNPRAPECSWNSVYEIQLPDECSPPCPAGEYCDLRRLTCADGSGIACSGDAQCPSGEYCPSAVGQCTTDPCDRCIADCQAPDNCCTCGPSCACGSVCTHLCP